MKELKLRLEDEEYALVREVAFRRGVTHQKALLEGLRDWIGDKPLYERSQNAAKQLTTYDDSRVYADTPEEVAEIIRRHWGDSRFRSCLLAMAKLWSLGAEEAIDALTSNCRTFQRGAEAIAELEAKGPAEPTPEIDEDAARARSLLEDENRDYPPPVRTSEKTGTYGPRRDALPKMGKALVRRPGERKP